MKVLTTSSSEYKCDTVSGRYILGSLAPGIFFLQRSAVVIIRSPTVVLIVQRIGDASSGVILPTHEIQSGNIKSSCGVWDSVEILICRTVFDCLVLLITLQY